MSSSLVSEFHAAQFDGANFGLAGRLPTGEQATGEQATIEQATGEQPQWYAIRTRSRCEKMVSDQFDEQGIENYLPLVTRTRKWSDRVKQVELPLFSGYAFVRIVACSPDKLRVLKAHGVAGFVGIHGAGTAIPENQIRDIRTLLESDIPFEEHASFKVGQRVRIKGGCLDGVEGVLSAHNGDESVMISVEAIQRSLSINIRSIKIQGYLIEAA